MAMDMTLVENWEFLWQRNNVLWPAPICGNDKCDHLQPELNPQLELQPEPDEPEQKPDPEAAVSCACSNDGGEKSSMSLKSMGEEQHRHQNHQEQQQQGQTKQDDQSLGLFERRHRRSVSDDMRLDTSRLFTARKDSSSASDIMEKAALQPFFIKEAQPIKDLKVARLETIASGKEYKEPSQAKMVPKIQQTAPWLKERKRATKSLTDLEFDEVKGFSELGFTFSEADLTPRVVQVLPGLQRLGKQGTAFESYHKVSRPYPSEDWLMRRPDPPVRKLQMPALRMQGVDMKENLKFWAHAVASTVKMEC